MSTPGTPTLLAPRSPTTSSTPGASTHQTAWLTDIASYSLMGSGQFDKAGILAADFSGLEAQSPGFAVRQSPNPPGVQKEGRTNTV